MKSKLSVKLSQLKGFSEPKIGLEQYLTPPQLAADIIHSAVMQGDIEGKKVVDLGTGTGILGIGAALAGAEEVYAIEKDEEALEIARKNADRAGVTSLVQFIQKDIQKIDKNFDTVVMNPPFSVHSDTEFQFFKKAFSLGNSVYSLAPRGASTPIKELAEENDHEVLGVEKYSIDLPPDYGFHTENSRETEVDFIVTRKITNGT